MRLSAILAAALALAAGPAVAQSALRSPVFSIAPGGTRTSATLTINDGTKDVPIGVINPTEHSFKLQSDSVSQIYQDIRLFGAKCDGTTDDTAAINKAIVAAGSAVPGLGGTVQIPAAKCRVAGTIRLGLNGINFTGQGAFGSELYFDNGSQDDIQIGFNPTQICGGGVRHLHITHGPKTGGNTLSLQRACDYTVEDVVIDGAWNGALVNIVNNVKFDFIVINGGYASDYGLRYTAPSDGVERADVFTFNNSNIQMQFKGGDCVRWDGFASTFRVFGSNFLGCNYGMHVQNLTKSSSYYPQFGQFDDAEFDGTLKGVVIDGGGDFTFVNSDLDNNNNSGTSALTINPDIGGSYTRGIKIAGGNIHDSPRSAAIINARDVNIVAVQFYDTNHAGSGSYPTVQIGPNADRVTIAASSMGQKFGDPYAPSYGVRVDPGAAHIVLADNIYNGAITSSVLDTSGAASLTGGIAFDGSAIGPTMADGGRSGAKQASIVNPGTASGTVASLNVATGSPGAYGSLAQIDGATPSLSLNAGGGDTGGMTISTSSPASTLSLSAAGNVNVVARGPAGIALNATGNPAAPVILNPGSNAHVQFASPSDFVPGNGVAVSLGSTGPAGAHANPVKWLAITDSAGNTVYIPAF